MTGVLDWSHARPGGGGTAGHSGRLGGRGGGGGGWYHCRVKMIGRSQGRSVVAAAAYRTGLSLRDEELNQTFDFTRRSGVETWFTLAPAAAPDWVTSDVERLWNSASEKDTRVNSQLGREVELALPASISKEQRWAVAREFSQALVDRYGVAVTAAIHEPSSSGDDRNHHLHALMTTRQITAEGLGKKTRVLDDRISGPKEITWIRECAADIINDALERAGLDERVDARSFEARGIDREPTQHLGPSATEIERQGRGSERGERNREIEERNDNIDRLVDELADIDAQILAEEERQLDERYGVAGDDEPPKDAPAAPEDSKAAWEARRRQASNAIEEAAPFRDLMREQGEMADAGAGEGWLGRTTHFIHRMQETVVETLRSGWRRVLDWLPSRSPDDPEPDNDIDIER
jgi:hypothetical protein